jgi:predicted RNase H-like nuclease (RuvC/YqgF family)
MDTKTLKFYKDISYERLNRINIMKEQIINYKEENSVLKNKIDELQKKDIQRLCEYTKSANIMDKYTTHLEAVYDKMKIDIKLLNEKITGYEQIVELKNDVINCLYQKNNIEHNNLCAVCYIKPKNMLFMPCKHISTCEECCQKVMETNNKCVICRENIESFDTVYI